MTLRQVKTGYFVVEGLNAFGTSFYFYYLFFFTARQFGFENLGNLSLAAMNGLVYTLMAWFGGRFGQRFGYFKALRFGLSTMAAALLVGAFSSPLPVHIVVMVSWTIGICFTWPVLEALASEKEDAIGLQRMVGIYNVVWAGASATSYFLGGLLIEKFGVRCLFWIPAVIHSIQILITLWLEPHAKSAEGSSSPARPTHDPLPLNPRPIARAKSFLRMAWWANPFAYVAINTVAAVVPSLARKMGLTPMSAGFFCSVWFFARFGTFLFLWRWTRWHYRLSWFLSAYLLLIGSFAAILLVPNLAVVVGAQLGFGWAVAVLYYSSLYYSMAVGEAKGEHGGVHESIIGAGIFTGPAIGAATLHFMPAYPNSSAWAVSLALCGGLAGLLLMIRRRR